MLYKYITSIDGLRAVAVLSVLIYHINPSFIKGGFSGVDIFFVISGYVVAMSLSKNDSDNFKQFLASFYRRRIIRILPPLVFLLILGTILTVLFVPNSWLSETISKTVISAFFGFSNIILPLVDDGYFSSRADFNPFIHTWSLGVEEQFYLLFPIIYYFSVHHTGKLSNYKSIIIWLIPLLLTASIFYSYYEVNHNQTKAYYLIFSRFWELAAGALLFHLHSLNKFKPKSIFQAYFFLLSGLILIILGFIYSDKTAFPFPWAFLPVLGSVFLINSFVYEKEKISLITYLFQSKIMIFIGKISYSLYLWHWLVFSLFRWTVGFSTLLQITVALLISILFSISSYYLIEMPLKSNKKLKMLTNKKILLRGFSILIICTFISGIFFLGKKYLSLSVTSDYYTWYPYDKSLKDNEISSKFLLENKIFILGDSHSSAYTTMMNKLKNEYNVNYQIIAKNGQSIADLNKPQDNIIIDSKLNEISKLSIPGDIVFLASLRMNRIGNQWGSFNLDNVLEEQNSEKSLNDHKIALEQAIYIIRRLETMGLNVIIDAPKPIFQSPLFRCSDWFNNSNPVCEAGFTIKKSILLKHRENVMNSISVLKIEFPNLTVWDPFPILCPDEECKAYNSNGPLFFDGDHLSGYGNLVLYPSFIEVIKSIKSN
jgi:peptidoglycan/LPS O-acetylase OafA/YrhL